MNFRIIVTYGPSLEDGKYLKAIHETGDCIYRINGAHASPEQIPSIANKIRSIIPDAKIMVDLPGNKVRFTYLEQKLAMEKGETFIIECDTLNFPDYPKHLSVGDLALTHDSTYTLEVVDLSNDAITFLPHQSGTLIPNKGLHVQGANETLPFLFEKDKALIKAAAESNIDYLSLSFVRGADDIKIAKELLREVGSDMKIISKIETALATENLGEILFEVDTINVDRGDLSADIGILKLPAVQERIVESAKRAGKDVFLATQFLHNMETKPVPLISEIADLHKTVKSGISGIQLSEETAVGKYPLECVQLIFDVYKKSFASA